MNKKKKIIILIFLLGFIFTTFSLLIVMKDKSKSKNKETLNSIDYFTIKGINQVYIDGKVTPVLSKEFTADSSLGTLGNIKVKNGQDVTKDTVLYEYFNSEVSSQISDLTFQIETTLAEKETTRKKMNLALNDLQKNAQDDDQQPSQTKESIYLEYDLSSFDIKINQLQNQINTLSAKKIHQVKAPFAGKITIPQNQNRESAILTLTSNNFYVEGSINEKDLHKIKEKQVAQIKTITNNDLYTGEITSISNTPISSDSSESSNPSASLSNYSVKLSINETESIRSGYHVQASINLDNHKISIPSKAIQIDSKTKQPYVFVDDFGTILRKDIKIQSNKDDSDNTVVINGLEGLDRVIVSSTLPLKNSTLIDELGPLKSKELN